MSADPTATPTADIELAAKIAALIEAHVGSDSDGAAAVTDLTGALRTLDAVRDGLIARRRTAAQTSGLTVAMLSKETGLSHYTCQDLLGKRDSYRPRVRRQLTSDLLDEVTS